MENGRRRIQLAASLFFTFPGLPVLYYGDEIGMGDHPHLPGRNPVRTPMQWSSDRNAGFSGADPEELYNPVIDDPLYSYTMVNVESQERFVDSHLWNVRRMIEVRNRQPALWSQGQFGVVETTHPALFAFTRRAGDETCLLVHNLSKSSVCGELRLGKFASLIPRELFGGALFPKIPRHPYLVTMTPYAFIWFELLPGRTPVRKKKAEAAP
jgi:maltose alpha-D-glucosyltransferase/alpha-amylase